MRHIESNYQYAYETFYNIAKKRNAGMSEEWYKKKAKEDAEEAEMAILRINVAEHLHDIGYGRRISEMISMRIVDGLPKELHLNINEWIDGKPISDIKYEGISINGIMKRAKELKRNYTFVECAEGMAGYFESGCRDISRCLEPYEVM